MKHIVIPGEVTDEWNNPTAKREVSVANTEEWEVADSSSFAKKLVFEEDLAGIGVINYQRSL